MKTFDQVWADISAMLKRTPEINTLCQGVSNQIMTIEDESITRLSVKTRKAPQKVTKEDFRKAWDKLAKDGINTLASINEIRGRRAFVCAVFAKLDYVENSSTRRNVYLRLKAP